MPTRPGQSAAISVLDALRGVSPLAVRDLQHAAQQLTDVLAAEQARGSHPVLRLMNRRAAFRHWDHLPARDVHDAASGACWFYHAHAPDSVRADPDEHGHFHCFVHRRHVARHGKCLYGPARAGPARPQLSHLAALAIRKDGMPLSWFTVTQPVTDDYVYPAAAMIRCLPKFSFAARGPLAPTTKWLQAMVLLYRPALIRLLEQRDAAYAAAATGDEILSTAPLQFSAYLDAVALMLG